MQLPATISPDAFTLDYRPEQGLLIGRWLRPVSLPEAQAIYEALLSAAVAHDCRHLLLDIRRRGIGEEVLYQWVREVFTPRLTAAFEQPVYAAYFAMVTHEEVTHSPTLEENIRLGSVNGAFFHYFNQEADCLAWLNQQP